VARRRPAPETLSPLYYLFAASQRAGTLLAEALADAPLDASGYALFSALRETQPTSPTDLARHLGMAVTTLLDAVAALSRRGLVVKLRNPRDGRSYLLRLSDEGESLHDRTEQFFSEADLRLRAHLGERGDDVIAALVAMRDAGDAALASLRAARAERTG